MDISNTRLKDAREKAGFKSAGAAARRFGWVTAQGNYSTYASHENGQTPIPKKRAKEYARKLKVEENFRVENGAAWLLGMDSSKPSSGDPDKNVLGLQPEMEYSTSPVPEFAMTAGAIYAKGQNAEFVDLAYATVRANWGLPFPFLNDELHIRSGRAHMLLVRGDSMEDALFDGDRAIIDLDDTEINQAGIFALLDDSAKLVIVQVMPVHGSRGQRILCTYANPRYPPFELPLEEPVKIVGRVAAKITRL